MARAMRDSSPFAGMAVKVVVTLTFVALWASEAQAWRVYSQPKCVANQQVFMSKIETCQTSFLSPLMSYKVYGDQYWKCTEHNAFMRCWKKETVACPGVDWFDKLLNANGWPSQADFVQFLETKRGSLCRFGSCPETKAVYDYESHGCALLANQTVQKQPDAANPECLRWKTFGECQVKILENCNAHYRHAWLEESLKQDGFGSKEDWVTFMESKMASKCREKGVCPASKADFDYESGSCMQQGMGKMGKATPDNRTCVFQQTSGKCILDVVQNCRGVEWYEQLELETARKDIAEGIVPEDYKEEDFDFIATTKKNMASACNAAQESTTTPATPAQEAKACPANEHVFKFESQKCFWPARRIVMKEKTWNKKHCMFNQTLWKCVLDIVQNCPGVRWYEELELKSAKNAKARGMLPADAKDEDFDFIADMKKQMKDACSEQ